MRDARNLDMTVFEGRSSSVGRAERAAGRSGVMTGYQDCEGGSGLVRSRVAAARPTLGHYYNYRSAFHPRGNR